MRLETITIIYVHSSYINLSIARFVALPFFHLGSFAVTLLQWNTLKIVFFLYWNDMLSHFWFNSLLQLLLQRSILDWLFDAHNSAFFFRSHLPMRAATAKYEREELSPLLFFSFSLAHTLTHTHTHTLTHSHIHTHTHTRTHTHTHTHTHTSLSFIPSLLL